MAGRIHKKRPMLELLYRESRIARVLGEPPKMAIVNLLLRKGPLTLTEIAGLFIARNLQPVITCQS